MDKVFMTANKQIKDIEKLYELDVVDLLDEKLKTVIEYRMKYKESSLKELAEIMSLETGMEITKSGLNMYSLALSNELKPFGIKVTSVMLGDAKTGFTKSRKVDNSGDDIYDKRISRSVSVMEHDEQNGQSPEYIAGIICRIAEKKNPSLLYSVGFVYKLVYALWKFAPLKFVNYIVYKIYAK